MKTGIKKLVLFRMFLILMLMLVGTTVQATTLNSVSDAEIDQHVNWNNGLKGIQIYWSSIYPDNNTYKWMDVGRMCDNFTSPVTGPSRWGLIKFDTSGIDNGTTVDNATLRITQINTLDYNPTTDVYQVNVDWDQGTPDGSPAEQPDPEPDAYPENGTSWVNFIKTAGNSSYNPVSDFLASGNITFIGTMTNAAGHTTFTNDNLTNLAQGWVNETISNYGLMLAWDDAAASDGENDMARYACNETTLHVPPQLIINDTVTDPESPTPPPGTIVAYSSADTQTYLGDPSIVILPNGDYIASHDAWGPAHGYSKTYLYRSTDNGSTWSYITGLYGQTQSSLFVHDGDLYLMGGSNNGVDIGIRKSTDNGTTWTSPDNSTTGQLLAGSNYAMAASPTIVHDGRLWRAVEVVDAGMPTCCSCNFRAFMMSCPVDGDLLNAGNWSSTNSLLGDDYFAGKGWFEGCAVVDPSDDMKILLRTSYYPEQAFILDVADNATTLSCNTTTTLIDFFGGTNGMFMARYDNVSKKYWTITQQTLDPTAVRNHQILASSSDMRTWTKEKSLLYDADSAGVGFQYASFVFDGDDIIYLSRTSYGGAYNFHDSNYISFHRIEDFRGPPGVTIAESNGATIVNETGPTSDTYTVVLDITPSDNVTITVDPDNQTDVGSGNGVTKDFIFTSANWSTPQTVTVTAVDDSDDEGNHTSTITHSAASSDADYNGIAIDNVTATVNDNDGAPPDNATYEAYHDAEIDVNTPDTCLGDDDEMRVHSGISYGLIKWDLSAVNPTTTVDNTCMELMNWDYPDGAINVYGIEAGDWDESSVTWNSWGNTSQTLNLLGSFTAPGSAAPAWFYNDNLTAFVQDWVDGDQTNYGIILKHTIAGDSFSTEEDTWGHGPWLTVWYDNVSTPGVTLVETSGSTAVAEDGPTSDNYTVVLDTQPTDNVTITVDPDNQTDVGNGNGVTKALTFTTANWDSAQTVTVTAVDDNDVEGAHNSTITHTAASSDSDYNGDNITIDNITANVTDDDTAGVTLAHTSGSTAVAEEGPTSDNYTVVLDTQPTDNVTITVDPDNESDVGSGNGVSTTLTFTSANWSSAQTVTVTAVDDSDIEGAHSSTITHAAASSDGNYNGIAIDNMTASITDNDDNISDNTSYEANHDAEIDVDTPDTALGTGAELRVHGEDSHILIHWDISAIPSNRDVDNATMELVFWESGDDGPKNVYSIDNVSWDQSTVTWNSWAAESPATTLLGSFQAGGGAGSSHYFYNDNFTALVEDWIDGDQTNYGIIIKFDTGTVGDSYSAEEDTYEPQETFHGPMLEVMLTPQ